jgi:hypothetical protein
MLLNVESLKVIVRFSNQDGISPIGRSSADEAVVCRHLDL